MSKKKYRSQTARDAQRMNYGDSNYWQYLDDSAKEHNEYYKKLGDNKRAKKMLTQSLSEALQGNNGN